MLRKVLFGALLAAVLVDLWGCSGGSGPVKQTAPLPTTRTPKGRNKMA
jgi:hypothetical protein